MITNIFFKQSRIGKQILLTLLFCLSITACDDGSNFAPVTDLSHIEPLPKAGEHRVVSGETLYSIAWRYGLDYRDLAALNHISPPYAIQIDQVIYLRGKENAFTKEKQAKVAIKSNKKIIVETIPLKVNKLPQKENLPPEAQVEPNYDMSKWTWPAKGKVISTFSSTTKGINIAGQKGEPIYSIGAGKVVYAGDGLRGYGNLIIVKHNSLYLSAYAHNNFIFVKEGNWVKRGQKIAEMGNTGTDKIMLHFEIRRAGKPINPMSLYQK